MCGNILYFPQIKLHKYMQYISKDAPKQKPAKKYSRRAQAANG